MFKTMTCALLTFGLSTAAFATEASLQCKVSRGYAGASTLLKEWDSNQDDSRFPEYKYYGVYMDGETYETSTSVYVIWGVDIGAGASPAHLNDRFQILAYGKGRNTGINVFADTDATKPIDLAVYVPGADITVRCSGN